jgi:hypothetical protein
MGATRAQARGVTGRTGAFTRVLDTQPNLLAGLNGVQRRQQLWNNGRRDSTRLLGAASVMIAIGGGIGWFAANR